MQTWNNVRSHILDMRTTLTVLTPEGGETSMGVRPQPGDDVSETPVRPRKPGLLILLHGLTGNNAQWSTYTNLQTYADKHNLVIVLPDGQRSFWINQAVGMKWGEWIGCELPALLRSTLRISRHRDDTYVGGLSMGGYGAIRAAFDYPKIFGGAFSLSGTLDVAEEAFRGRHPDLYAVGFGDSVSPRAEDDLLGRLESMREGEAPKPTATFFTCCGEGDRLFGQNLRFIEAAEAAGLDLASASGPGVHNFRFWNDWLPIALETVVL